jgi:glycerol-3-phosphate dehydrogenase
LYGRAVLPGGDFAEADFAEFLTAFNADHPWLPEHIAARYARAYGIRARLVLGDAERLADLGHEFGAGLYQREVEYLMAYEWARETDDILLRCSKLALHGGPELRAALNEWLARRDPRQAVRVAAAV